MSSPPRSRDKQVQLTVFDNEPMARLAEQRLKLEGIPSLIRSLHGGPGLWGSAYNLPHGLYVYESDQSKARDILGLVHLNQEEIPSTQHVSRNRAWLVFLAIAIVVVLVITAPAFLRLFG